MSTSNRIRWAGLAAVLGGVLYALAALLHPAGEDAAAVLSPTWVTAHAFGGVSGLFTLLGLAGLYARQAERAGRLGLIGFVSAFIGIAMSGPGEFLAAFVSPFIAAKAPALFDEVMSSQPTGPALAFQLVMIAGLVVGYILFGIATVRAGVLPRWGGWLLIAGVLLAFGSPLSHIIGIVAAAVLGLGLVWLGYALWSGKSEVGQQHQPAPVGL